MGTRETFIDRDECQAREKGLCRGLEIWQVHLQLEAGMCLEGLGAIPGEAGEGSGKAGDGCGVGGDTQLCFFGTYALSEREWRCGLVPNGERDHGRDS